MISVCASSGPSGRLQKVRLRHCAMGGLDIWIQHFFFFSFFFNLWRIRSFCQTTLIQSAKLKYRQTRQAGNKFTGKGSKSKQKWQIKKLRRVNRRGTLKGFRQGHASAGVVIGEWETGAWVDSGDWDRWKSLRAPGGQMENAGALKLVSTCLET